VGHDQVGLVDGQVADQEDVDIEGSRPPSLAPHALRLGLQAVSKLQELVGAERRLDGHDRVQVVGLRRSTDGRGLVHR
jgi:hypothetical protein